MNATKAIGYFIWGIIKGELNQFASILNINLNDLFNQIKDTILNYKAVFAQLMDLISNPTVLLRLAVAKLNDFQYTEFYQKFYMLGVFVAGFTGGAVLLKTAEKTVEATSNLIKAGKITEQANEIKNSLKTYNLAQEIYTDAQKTAPMAGVIYKWMPLDDGLWVPLKKLKTGKIGTEGANVNWHIQDGNFDQKRFGALLDSTETIYEEQKILNARVVKECNCCPAIVSNNNFIQNLFFGIKVHALPACGNNNPITNSTRIRGGEEHNKWKLDAEKYYGKGYKTEVAITKGSRPDAVNYSEKKIKELKPNSPTGIARGKTQIKRYVDEMKQKTGDNGWTGEVVYYNR